MYLVRDPLPETGDRAGIAPSRQRTAVVGVGNADRGDDAAGRLAARSLRAVLPPEIAVVEMLGDAASLVEVLAEYDAVFVVDAVRTGTAEPGQLHRLAAHTGPLPTAFHDVSTHGFGVGEGIELARTLGRLPPTVVVYGIEARDFAHGQPPSPAVGAGIERAVAAVHQEVVALS